MSFNCVIVYCLKVSVLMDPIERGLLAWSVISVMCPVLAVYNS